MSQLHLQQDIGNWVVNFAFWVCLLFPIITAAYWPWWKDHWGWSIVILELLVPAALLAGILRIDFGLGYLDPILFGWIELGAVGLIPLVVVHRIWLIWHKQRQSASDSGQEPANDSAKVCRRDQPG